MKKQFKFLFLSVLLFPLAAFSGNITAQVPNSRLPYGETFDLKILYDGDDATMMQPELSVLHNDFTVYSTSASIQSRFINGRGQQTRQWTISLMPKREGKITIPAIAVGQYKTEPINIEVLAADDITVPSVQSNNQQNNQPAPATANAHFTAQLEMAPMTPYVQQEINAVLTVEDNRGLEFASAPTFEDTPDWVIKELNQPIVEMQNGKRLIKFAYAMFPQKSGQIQIPVAHIDGAYTSFESTGNSMQNSVNGFFKIFDLDLSQMFGVQKPVHLSTRPKKIYVKPIPPENEKNWWLPASAMKISARWSDERPVFKVGEAVSREITIQAVGVSDTQLPELLLPENPAFKQYPEKPQLTSVSDKNQIVSQAVIRIVYIPQQGGRQVIPEIRIPWFNTQTEMMEIAEIPAEEMVIGGGTAAVEHPSAASGTVSATTDDKNKTEPSSVTRKTENAEMQTTWMWIAAAFVAGILVSLLFRRRDASAVSPRQSAYVRDIEQHLSQRDYRALRDALMAWGKMTYPALTVNNLNDLAAAVGSAEFTEQMQILNSILYAGSTALLDREIILRGVKNKRSDKKKEEASKPLPDLYK